MGAVFDWQDTGPIHPQDIFPGVGSGHAHKVPFDRQLADVINNLYMSSPMVSTAVNQMVSFLTRTNIVIEGDGADIITPEQIKYELQPAINKMMLEWILYGYTNVCKGKSRVNPGRSTINVVPFTLVQQTLEWDNDWSVKYSAEVTSQLGKKQTNIDVLCMYPPDERGILDSPLAHCVSHLAYAEHLWTTYITGSERAINPVFIFTRQQKLTGTLPGIERATLSSSVITSGGIGQVALDKLVKNAETGAAEHTKKVLDEARTQRTEALAQQQAERERIKAAAAHDITYDTDRALPKTVRGKMSLDPLGNIYVAPDGHDVASSPDFKTPADFTRVLEIVAEELYRALGLPIIMLHARADTSSSVDFAVRSLNASVTEMHTRASALISKVLNKYIAPDIKRERVDAALAKDVLEIAADTSSSSSSSLPKETLMRETNLVVSFTSTPITTFELAQAVYNSGVISDEFYQSWALTVLNLPPEAKREGMVEWLNQQRESEAGAKRQRTQ